MTLNTHIKSAALSLILGLSTALGCQLVVAQERLKSTMQGGNYCTGNYFDITAKEAKVRLSGFGLHLAQGKHSIKVYTKAGSYIGSEAQAEHWSLYTEKTVRSKGKDTITPLSVKELTLGPLDTMGFALVSDNMMIYTNSNGSNEFHENKDMSVYAGDAVCGEAFSKVQEQRVWNGVVYYNDDFCFVMVPGDKRAFQVCL